MHIQRTTLSVPCAQCGTDFYPRVDRRGLYCSQSCAGKASRGRPRRPAVERFWEKVNKDGPIPDYAPNLGQCWLWTGAWTAAGYGKFLLDGKAVLACRVAYEWEVGPIAGGLVPDHLCRVRLCVRPTHIEPVTETENFLRGMHPRAVARRAGACLNGHEMTDENTYRWFEKVFCRSCKRDRRARLRAEEIRQ